MDIPAYIESQAHRDPNLERIYYRGYWKGVFQGIASILIAVAAALVYGRFMR